MSSDWRKAPSIFGSGGLSCIATVIAINIQKQVNIILDTGYICHICGDKRNFEEVHNKRMLLTFLLNLTMIYTSKQLFNQISFERKVIESKYQGNDEYIYDDTVKRGYMLLVVKLMIGVLGGYFGKILINKIPKFY